MKTNEKVRSKIKLVKFDPWLEPYEDHIKTRISKYKKDRKKLLSDADDFTDFAKDDSTKVNTYKQLSLFGNELDTPNGCGESCEAF